MRDDRQGRSGAARGVAGVAATITLLAAGAIGPARAASKPLELTPTIGWQWGGTLDGYEQNGITLGGDVHVNAALNYGGAIGMEIRPGEWAELGYSYQSSEVIVRPAGKPSFKVSNLGTHYIQASGARNLIPHGEGKAYPYVMGGLGMAIFSPGPISVSADVPATTHVGTQYLFAMSAGGGIRVKMNEKADLRLQARLLLPVNWASGGLYFGTGGAGVGVSGGSFMPQGEATLGLTFKLGQEK